MTVQTEMQEQTEAPVATPEAPTAPQTYRDSDDDLLEQSLREANGGDAVSGDADTTTEQGESDAAATPEPGTEATTAETQADQATTDQRMVPLAAVLGERRKAAELAQQVAYLQGALDAIGKQGPAGNGAAPAQPGATAAKQPTIADEIAGIDGELVALAEKIDEGILTASEARKLEIGLISKRQDLVTAQAVAQIEARIQPQSASQQGSLYLQDQTAQLEMQHPYLHLLAGDADWNLLTNAATRELQERGVALDDSEASKLLLRQTVAALSDRYGPVMTGVDPASVHAAVQQRTGRVLPRPGATMAPARPTKQSMAARMPPDPLSVPRGSASTRELTPQQFISKPDDELARMTDAELDSLLARSG